MKLVLETFDTSKGPVAMVAVDGVTSQPMEFSIKGKETERQAFDAALHRLKHIYLSKIKET
jgi:hypothetical protein